MSEQSSRRIEHVYFRYSCSENEGLISLVEPDSENLHHYDDRDCETLESVIWWTDEGEVPA